MRFNPEAHQYIGGKAKAVSFVDPEHALRAAKKVMDDALWRLDSARSQLRWATADGHSQPALDACAARITEAEDLIGRLCVQYMVATVKP